MKKMYYYLFFKFYKFSESAPSRWMSDWKASLLMDVLLLFLFSSLLNYYKIFIDNDSNLGKGNLLFFAIIIISVSNYFIFHHNDTWKVIVKDFNKLPKQKDKIGSWIVFVFVLLIMINIIFSFYMIYLSK